MRLPAIRKSILQLLSDGEFHSGVRLADTLNISRSAVWKQLNSLTELGIETLAVSGKGYRLAQPLQLFDADAIEGGMNARVRSLVSELIIHDQISSTNTYLLECAHAGAPAGLVCLAEYQSAGKGRRGRQWVSPFGANIYLSLLWRYQHGPAGVSGLSLAAGVAAIRALRSFGVHEAGLKWPNDIYWQDRKLGGILVEVSGETEGPCVVVMGIGLNVFLPARQAQGINQPWTDLTAVMNGHAPPRNALAAALINELLPALAEFDAGGIADYLQEWRGYDCMYGKRVSLLIGSECRDGFVMGIDDKGLLLLRQQDGTVRAFASGEVSFRR
ncbi:MAG: bifunctional biotin--[acetyl-CoA-carboxylase] ligase/biotin operon repressor BirA [Gammaproteobacteria bacterium]